MFGSSFGSETQGGAIAVVPEADGIVAVCLKGDFDLTNAPVLANQLDRVLEDGNDLIVDLGEATFIDSSVIHVLVQAARAARRRNRTMVLQLGTAATVERVLELADIEQVLPRAHERQEAVRIIQQRAGAS